MPYDQIPNRVSKNHPAHKNAGICLTYSATGDQVITSGEDNQICFWNYKNCNKETYINLRSASCQAMSVSKDNELMITALSDNTMYLYKMKTLTKAKN